ncbi:Gfo/Idh/MocA family oxidoreductase [Hyunsoonleella pacifica]|uniref:Oxidoreductase n=1 Tax=Hyunsoonleella pacifica TaxID=1080224 RepID=A0A4Q9FSJ4_9FLAO|nr:Gfo/Idh/MocA family oxidoreductase [Hyunsoonleella pacifica]TBN16594.1 oxidoreductase [Hyunsoonleella pacifica]GGD18126.1 oxidoreductase [Hyunsoonleella pacifica]
MNTKIKTGVLSFGMSGSLFHCPFLESHTGFELTAIVERSKKQAHKQYTNIKSYDSFDDLLNDTTIELVVINTPSATHFEFALKAIQHKKHILVEKPLTITAADAKTLYQEAKKRNCLIMPFQNRRYDSDFLSVKGVVESGKLGKLIEVHFRYDRYKYALGANLNKELPIPGNGVLYNLVPHALDAAIALFGIPEAWEKTLHGNRPETQIDDYAHIHLKYPSGLQVFLTASLLVANVQPAFVLHGAKGSYIKERTDVQETQLQAGIKPNNPLFGVEAVGKEGILTTIKDQVKTQEKIAPTKSSYLNIFEAVYQTIRNKAPYPVTEIQVVKQIEILED